MQRIQDKDLDQLFKDQLGNAEMEPPEALWGRISGDIGPRKRSNWPYWMSAAAVLLLGFGIGLMRQEPEKVRLRADSAQSKVFPANAMPVAAEPGHAVAPPRSAKQSTSESTSNGTPLVIAPRATEKDYGMDPLAMQPKRPEIRPVDKAEVPAEPEEKDDKITFSQEEQMIASVEPPADPEINTDIAETGAGEHRGIRNVGDLVNFVVNKVDRREHKLVQFDTDDDNSSLVSLNLGILKISKRNK